MNARLRALLRRPGFRYLLVGGSVYVLEVLVILLAQHLGASAVMAVGTGFWFGLVISFVLQKFVAFNDKRTHRRVLLPQVLAVSALVLFNFGFTLLVTKLLTPHVPAVVSRTVALAITVIWNFYLYKTRIFKSSDDLIY
jgi:putative flippase GtrA